MLFKKKMAESPESVSFLDDMEEIEMVDTEVNSQNTAGTEDASGQNGEVGSHEADLIASISRNTIIRGDIDTQDNIDIFGNVNGYVSSDAVVKVYGNVLGDVKCATLVSSSGGKVTGNVDCTKSAVLGEGTMIEGNVNTGIASISGKIKGNLVATESVTLGSKSSVIGDITTPEIEVSKGAVIYGSVVMERSEPVVVEEPPVKHAKVVRSPVEPEPVVDVPDYSSSISSFSFDQKDITA